MQPSPSPNSISSLGYCGYIPGIVSENVFGETYGKTSYASSAKTFERGMDEPAHLKYNTTMKKEFIDHATRTDKVETTAEQVGVVRTEDVYKKVSHFATAHSNSSIARLSLQQLSMLSLDQMSQPRL